MLQTRRSHAPLRREPQPLSADMQWVLLVEDSWYVREGLTDLINASDSARVIASAATEEEAAKLASTLPVDIVIVDINLREGSGLGFLQRLQNMRMAPDTRVVYTNHSDWRVTERCKNLGATHVLHKGGDFGQLLRIFDDTESMAQA